MWNVKIDPIRKLQIKICLFGDFMSKYVFFEIFQILIWYSYKKADTTYYLHLHLTYTTSPSLESKKRFKFMILYLQSAFT